jgi:TPR repeat protein
MSKGAHVQSLELLKARRYRASDRPESYPLAGPWREKSAIQGEQWLRFRADDGDCFAMERLAEHLLLRKESRNGKEEAVAWLRRASHRGSLSARYMLAICFLDDGDDSDIAEGWDLLRQAAAAGFLTASRELGLRLLMAKAPAPDDIAEGERCLRSAAASGDRLAMIFLGRFLTTGRYVQPSPTEGMDWLARAGASKSAQVPRFGLFVYRRALEEFSPVIRQRLCDEAADLLLEGYHNNDSSSSLNLGYLVRRGEVHSESFPPLDRLLQESINQGSPFAIVNEALRRAAGVQCAIDWEKADGLIRDLPGTTGVFEWWFMRSQAGDAEGHMVLGWLTRHGLTADPDDLEPCQRFAMISRDKWDIPKWMEV